MQADPHILDGDKDGVRCEGSNYSVGGGNGNSSGGGGSSSANECQAQADCFRGTVTEVVDGDTLDINNVRVRLALVNTPERGQSGYSEAIDLVQSVCSVGTMNFYLKVGMQLSIKTFAALANFPQLVGFKVVNANKVQNSKRSAVVTLSNSWRPALSQA